MTSKAKEIKRLERENANLEAKIRSLNDDLVEMPKLRERNLFLEDLNAAYENLKRDNERLSSENKQLEIAHEKDVKARSNTQLTLKLSRTKSERYQKKMQTMSTRLARAEKEIARMKKQAKDHVQANRMQAEAEVKKENAELAYEKVKEDLDNERNYRLRELAIIQQTEGALAEVRRQLRGAEERIDEEIKATAKERVRTIAVKKELEAERNVKAVRAEELRLQSEEIARLNEVVERQNKMYEIQKGEIFQWGERYKRLREAFRVLQKRLADSLRKDPSKAKTASAKAELVSPADMSLLEIARERKERMQMMDHRARLESDTHSRKIKYRDLDIEPIDKSAAKRSMHMSGTLGSTAPTPKGAVPGDPAMAKAFMTNPEKVPFGTGQGKGPGIINRGGKPLRGVRSSRGRVVGFKDKDAEDCEREQVAYLPGSRVEALSQDVSTGVGGGMLSDKYAATAGGDSVDAQLRRAGYTSPSTLSASPGRGGYSTGGSVGGIGSGGGGGGGGGSRYVTSGDAGAGTATAAQRAKFRAQARREAGLTADDSDSEEDALADIRTPAGFGADSDDGIFALFGAHAKTVPLYESSQQFLEDEALVSAVLESERKDIQARREAVVQAEQRADPMEVFRKSQRLARRAKSAGAPPEGKDAAGDSGSGSGEDALPPRPPSAGLHTKGSVFVGAGLGYRKGLGDDELMGSGGSARQILERILQDNPEVERLRRLEANKRVG